MVMESTCDIIPGNSPEGSRRSGHTLINFGARALNVSLFKSRVTASVF